jgi:hypothetical protein
MGEGGILCFFFVFCFFFVALAAALRTHIRTIRVEHPAHKSGRHHPFPLPSPPTSLPASPSPPSL